MTTWDTNLRTFCARLANAPVQNRLRIPKTSLDKLEALGITTIGELKGALTPLPPESVSRDEAKRRCLSPKWVSTGLPEDRYTQGKSLRRLARAIGLPLPTVRRLAEAMDRTLPQLYADAKSSRSEWYLGMTPRKPAQTKGERFVVRQVRDEQHFKVPARKASPFFLPGLSRLGNVWDQAERGTCVAQACAAQVAYLAGGFDPSTQMLYHNAKCIDGIPDEEGTFLLAALRAVADPTLSGEQPPRACDFGVPPSSAWPYESQPVPRNPGQTPPPPSRVHRLYEGKRYVGSPKVLACSQDKSKVVDDIRWLLTQGLPVMGGFPLYESFQNVNSRRTGKITLPLPGESLVGYHAMTIVAFDDQRQLFIVRNSWSAGWGWECPYHVDGFQLAGHASIPYAYFTKNTIDSIEALALMRVEVLDFVIPEEARLYNRRTFFERHTRAASPRIAATIPAPRKARKRSWWEFLRVG